MADRAQAPDAEQLALLIESVRDYAIFLLDADGRVATWNPGAERIKGYTAEEILGAPYERFFTEEDRRRGHPGEILAAARRDGRYEEESWRLHRDGRRFWANIVITAVYDHDGRHVGYAKVTRDLTERLAAETALRDAHDNLRRANEELDRFAVVAAHDLSEPLTTVSGFASLLLTRHGEELSQRAHEFVTHILASTERMQQLIETLLAYARAGQHPRPHEPVAVREAGERVVADLQAAITRRAAEVALEIGDDVVVTADGSDVELVLQNLIANAVKFGGGSAGGESAPPRVTVSATRVGDDWRIDVRDDGAGIALADQARIFAAFQRADETVRRSGTGLGLAICERIVHRIGGTIGVESTPGKGSRFWVRLPAA